MTYLPQWELIGKIRCKQLYRKSNRKNNGKNDRKNNGKNFRKNDRKTMKNYCKQLNQ